MVAERNGLRSRKSFGLRGTLTAIDADASIDAFDIATVPVPAAAWLFLSGLIWLAGTVRLGARSLLRGQ